MILTAVKLKQSDAKEKAWSHSKRNYAKLRRNQSIFPFMLQYAMGIFFYRMKLVKPKDLRCVKEKKG